MSGPNLKLDRQRPYAERMLLVDDDPAAIRLLQAVFAGETGLELHVAESQAEAVAKTAALRPGLILLDLVLPGVVGMSLLSQLLQIVPAAEIILTTADYSTASAVEAIQTGAAGYLTKPLEIARLRSLVNEWLDRGKARRHAAFLEEELAESSQFEDMVGRSPAIIDVYNRIRRIAPYFTTALVVGETGTGKELAARALHRRGPCAGGPFVVCNCAAISEHLFESELFGHAKGSFTGAYSTQKGLIEHAAGGTIFLDEIGDVPLATQAKLLRFLQSREIQRVGDPSFRQIDVRVVAATNRNLAEMAEQRLFREDLYYRLSTITLRLPILTERREDIRLLAHHFLKTCRRKFGRPDLEISRRSWSLIQRYHWPGNIRELENTIQYCSMMTASDTIEPEDFPEAIRAGSKAASEMPDFFSDELRTIDEITRLYVDHVLSRVNGNRVRAAQILGIGRATLYRILNRAHKGRDPIVPS